MNSQFLHFVASAHPGFLCFRKIVICSETSLLHYLRTAFPTLIEKSMYTGCICLRNLSVFRLPLVIVCIEQNKSYSRFPHDSRSFPNPLRTALSLSSLQPSLAPSSEVPSPHASEHSFILANHTVALSISYTCLSESSYTLTHQSACASSVPTHDEPHLI